MGSPITATNSTWVESMALAEIGLVLLVLGVAAFVAVKVKLSVVPFYLVIGLSLGKGGLVPLDLSETFLDTGAQLGAILLLLMLGLEHSGPNLAAAFMERKSIGAIDFFLNAVPGALIGLLLGWGILGAVVLGGITYVSSSGIAAQMMKETGWQRSEVSRRVTTVLVVEDLTLAPYLPLLTTLVTGAGAIAGFISVTVAILVTAVALVISFRGENALGKLINTQAQGGLLLSVFGAALLAAGSAELVGFSSAVAAFLVGLALTGEVAHAVRLRLAPLRDLFAAIFFLFFGLSVSPAEMIDVLPLAVVLTALGIAGKMYVGWNIARDMSDGNAWKRAGAFLIPRGEFSIVIAGLAASTSFGGQLQALTITYVLLTSLAASIALRSFRSSFEKARAKKKPKL
ncbi:cation:proton antiporter [Rhodoluna sp. KAS3]|uniref:cation:proton antiporter n=1 Tax=Rhodoluna sp. KAS3 TaxID=942880 RepID=UPI002230B83B|nr:cation:proton antiporter [Rhodoluna sp. KAS3]BDS49202.1 potassium transporter [Rhodoluna sp. KAS3]